MAAKTVNELTLKLNADMAELKKDLSQARQHLTGFQKGISDIGASLKSAFTIGAIVAVGIELSNFVKEASALGSQLEGTFRAFEKLNDPNLLDQLRTATGGTITDLELMKKALDADDMKVSLQDLPLYFQLARNEVQETGGSVTEFVDTIINGIGKESPKVITQLGIPLKDFKEELKRTGDYTTALNDLIRQKVSDSGTYIENASDITKRWQTRWDNMKAGLGVLIDRIIVKIAPILEKIRDWFIEVWKVSTKFIIDTYNGYVDLYNESMAFRVAVESIGIVFKTVWGVIKAFFNIFIDNLKGLGKTLVYVINPANWGEGFGKGLAKILADTGGEVVNDLVALGKDIGDSINEGIENVRNGKASYITLDDIVGSGGGNKLVNDVKPVGKNIGQSIGTQITSALEAAMKLSRSVTVGGGGLIPLSMITKTKENLTALNEVVKTEMANIKNSVIGMSIDVSGVFTDIFVVIGEGLGNAFTNTGNALKTVFLGIMDIILNFASSLGKELIALGLAAVSLKALFANPLAAIAAGTALIAISKLVKNMISKGTPKFAYGGIVPGSSFSGDRVPIMANSGEMVLNKNQQANLFRQINGGSMSGNGGILTARVSGSDLLFVVEQAKQKKGYAY